MRRVRDVLTHAARALRGAGVAAPEREARVLWAGITAAHPAEVWLARDDPAEPAALARFDAMLRRRVAGEPLAYVLGTAAFRTLDLAVDRRVLIPRPETEGLVQRVLDWASSRYGADQSWGVAADVGTGSGCVALSLAVEGRFERVVATDLSAGALAVAAHNVRHVAPRAPVHLVRGSFVEALASGRFTVVAANPPYVAAAEWAEVDEAVASYEPAIALKSGEDGLDATRGLLAAAARCLCPGGLLALELDSRRSEAVLEAAQRLGWGSARVAPDLFGRPRFLLATRSDGA